MSADDSKTSAPGPVHDLPVAIARSPGGANPGGARGIRIDPGTLLAGGAVGLIGVAVLAVFLWMVPTAAAREQQAACRGIRSLDQFTQNQVVLCPNGAPCALPVPAPDFTAKDMKGNDVRLSDYRGKVVLLNFWASWCGVCKTEKPALHAMAADMASDDFVVIALASDHAWADALTAVLESLAPQAVPEGKPTMDKVSAAYRQAFPNSTPFKLLIDPPSGDENIGKITASWGVKAVPESVLIDRQGRIRAYFVNKRDWQSPVAQTCLRSVIDEE